MIRCFMAIPLPHTPLPHCTPPIAHWFERWPQSLWHGGWIGRGVSAAS